MRTKELLIHLALQTSNSALRRLSGYEILNSLLEDNEDLHFYPVLETNFRSESQLLPPQEVMIYFCASCVSYVSCLGIKIVMSYIKVQRTHTSFRKAT